MEAKIINKCNEIITDTQNILKKKFNSETDQFWALERLLEAANLVEEVANG